MNRRGLLVSIFAFALLVGGLAARSGTLALLSLPFLAYIAVGLLEAPRGAPRLTAERSVDSARAAEGTEVSVRVTVKNDGPPIPVLVLSDQVPPGCTVSGGAAEVHGGLSRGERVLLEYSFRSARGVFEWSGVGVTAFDPFRLFPTERNFPAKGEIVVRPRVMRFRPFVFTPEYTLRSPGSILGNRAGNGTDFRGVREYQPGDQLRRLDWRRAARHPGRLFTREHEQEDIADIGLVLDARGQADLRSGTRHLVDASVDATASLCEMFLRGGNRVGMVLLSADTSVIHPGCGKAQLQRLLRALAGALSGPSASSGSLDRVPLRVFSTRALMVIISPLTGGDWQLFPRLRARGNEGLLISPDPADFTQVSSPDVVSRLARRTARLERRLNLRRVSRLGIRVVDWQSGQALAPLVRHALQPSRGASQGAASR